MLLIIGDTYPNNGKKIYTVDSIYMDRLITYLDGIVELPDPRSPTLRAPVKDDTTEACDEVDHKILLEAGCYVFCYVCGERLLS